VSAARAAKLSRIPGVTIAEACARFGVTKAAVARARRDPASKPSLDELALAALTDNGARTSGTADFAAIARWLDYIDHSSYSADEIRAMLARCPQLAIDGDRWTLTAPWP
jgi:transposase-like protein